MRKPRLSPSIAALLAFACRDKEEKSSLYRQLAWSRSHGDNVLAGRRGVEPEELSFLSRLVSHGWSLPPAGSGPFDGWRGAPIWRGPDLHWGGPTPDAIEEITRLCAMPPEDSNSQVLRMGFDELIIRGCVLDRDDLEARLARLMRIGSQDAPSGQRWILRGLSLAAAHRRRWDRSSLDHYRYERTLTITDDRDDTTVARLDVGLVRGYEIANSMVRLQITGQGCSRGMMPPLLRELLGGLVDLDHCTLGADVALDLNAPVGAIMVLDRRSRYPLRRALGHTDRTHRPQAFSGLEQGSRSSRVSIVVYDKKQQVKWARISGDCARASRLTRLAASYAALPQARWVTRIEVRARAVEGAAGLEAALLTACDRFLVADVRRAHFDGGVDLVLWARIRQYGLSRCLPSERVMRKRASLRRNRWTEDELKAGYCYLLMADLIAKGAHVKTARRHALAVRDRVVQLVEDAATATALDLREALRGTIRQGVIDVLTALAPRSATSDRDDVRRQPRGDDHG